MHYLMQALNEIGDIRKKSYVLNTLKTIIILEGEG